ncbi:S-4TM family putative pore-forming effector [Paenibacillus albus]|uniref:Uncharacterized protein n=1 Tax=Paenibacillus albus TaxID=2495582 RepID=A0A3Q8X6H9_9BACL|nr:S-4TM family putative pore-forming effector [Paenibacillus albus]AZN40404.1 hypothetical protein EJC50_12650 [Paenibacillus albus]
MLSKQNDSKHQALLVALRYYYDRAKMLHRYRVSGNILMALLGLVMSMVPGVKPVSIYILPVIGFVWLLLSVILLQELEKKITRRAATIQEEFDTSLFELPWRDRLVGRKASPEQVAHASQRFKGDRSKLLDWYTGLNAPSHFLNVLLAQRSSLAWDVKLRKRYAILVGVLSLVYLITTITICWRSDLKTYILTMLIPSASILLHGITTCSEHWRRALSCEEVVQDLLELYRIKARNLERDILHECREFQDFIFLKRCDITLIPNKIYWLSRDNDDQVMKQINAELSNISHDAV